MRFSLGAAVLTGVLAGQPADGAPPISLRSLLAEMTDHAAVARYPDPPYLCTQFSSYDRAATSPTNADTWFANGDASQYLRVEENAGRKEWVMVDADGPGAVVRFWSANPKGNVRVYIDGAAEPVIQAPMSDLLGGKALVDNPLSQESSRGWNLYLPIPYAKHCKITSDSDGFYYQVNVRTYPEGTTVESFKKDSISSLPEGAIKHAQALLSGSDPAKTLPLPDAKALTPGANVTLDAPPGPGSVVQFKVRVDAAKLDQALRSTIVVMEFDGERTVWCPLGDFFATGLGISPFHDWYRTVDPDGAMAARWVMPYQKSAKIMVVNVGRTPVNVAAAIAPGPWTWDDLSMHFHATWRQEYPIHTKAGHGTEDWNYVEVTGKGVFVGDNLNVVNPVPEWWGEGDEKIYVDGESFPSHFGTGTEDYYGYAWCCPETFEHPFHAQPRCDGGKYGNNWGYTSVTRVRSLDSIPFTKSLKFDIEVWHWAECDIAYAATSCFYAIPGATTNRRPDLRGAAALIVVPTPLPAPFKVEGALECEDLKVLSASSGTPFGPQGGFGPKLWSGGAQLWVQGKQAGDFVEIAVPAAATGPQKLTLYATKSWDYGIVRFTVNGMPAGPDVDLFNDKARDVVNTGPIELGTFEPKDGRFVLRAEVVGGNARSEGSKSLFGLDCITLSPAK